jgi:hypothetical protein
LIDTAGTDRVVETARWTAGLFLLIVVFQRFALPGVPVAMLVVLIPLWCGVGAARGLLVIDGTRLRWWCAAAGVTALAMPVQSLIVPDSEISITAWGLFVAVWLPFTLRLAERGTEAYRLMLKYVTTVAAGLAALCLLMIGWQVTGHSYADWFGQVVPVPLQLTDFVITYPVSFGSAIYKANAWIGLEPSMVSVQLGLGLLAALYTRARAVVVALLVGGLVATLSGSGIAIVLVGVVVMLGYRSRQLAVRYLPVVAVAVAVAGLTSFGKLLFDRSSEFGTTNSSASLRALQPYGLLFPDWRAHLSGALLGYGPGSSQRLVTESNVVGLLVPSPAKVFFEYGLLPGVVLAAFMLLCYWGGVSRAFSLSLLVSLWFLQPGTTTSVIVAPLLVFVALWSPRSGELLEHASADLRGDHDAALRRPRAAVVHTTSGRWA